MPWKLDELVNNLMNQVGVNNPTQGVELFNSGAWQACKVLPRWKEREGIFYFSVASDRTSGRQWIKRLEKNGLKIYEKAKEILCSPGFKATGGIEYGIAVIKPSLIREYGCTIKDLLVEMNHRFLKRPGVEIACLIREYLSDKEIGEMGLDSIVTLHEPVDGILLGITLGHWRLSSYGYDLDFCYWDLKTAFAFIVWEAILGEIE
ncbi:MAG: hypothetical protein WC858_03365 [Parcubacteria group bacterium]